MMHLARHHLSRLNNLRNHRQTFQIPSSDFVRTNVPVVSHVDHRLKYDYLLSVRPSRQIVLLSVLSSTLALSSRARVETGSAASGSPGPTLQN